MSYYSKAFKSRMVQKMTAPGGPSAYALAQEVGVHASTLSRWCHQTANVMDMKMKSQNKTSSRSWSAAEKLKAVFEASSLSEDDLGPFLRRSGLYRKDLDQWREQMILGLEMKKARPRATSKTPEGRRIRELEKEVHRKNAALAETAALLVLKKKAQAIWGAEDNDTTPSSGK